MFPNSLPPVWLSKTETDACYDACARLLLAHVREDIERGEGLPAIAVMFGTHNWASCRTILNDMHKLKLAIKDGEAGDEEAVLRVDQDVMKRISFAQLYGGCFCLETSFLHG
jgi:proline dehydrogenase